MLRSASLMRGSDCPVVSIIAFLPTGEARLMRDIDKKPSTGFTHGCAGRLREKDNPSGLMGSVIICLMKPTDT